MSMTRSQAEHILDAYLYAGLMDNDPNMQKLRDTLRELILDAMTAGSTQATKPSVTLRAWDGITVPTISLDGNGCSTKATFTGVDPAYPRNTTEVEL